MKNNEKSNRCLLTVRDFALKHSWPSEPGLRHLIINAKTNGFHKVIRRAGRRVLIDEALFFQWMDENHHE